jgi:hypothetical protein
VLGARAKFLGYKHAAQHGAKADGFERAGSTLQLHNLPRIILGVEGEPTQIRVICDLDHICE